MGAETKPPVVDIFKRVYGGGHDLTPEDYLLQKKIPFSSKGKVGEKYLESVILSYENGVTLGGSGYDIVDLNPAVAGTVKQVEVQPYTLHLPSLIPDAVISRSAGAGDKAFFDATKHIVKNNIKSHSKFREILMWYGQSSKFLGTVSYATATFRGVAYTAGADGSALTTFNGSLYEFTAGINAANKLILFKPGDFAAGVWVGAEGMKVQQILVSSGAVVAEGSLVAVDTENCIIQVDFTPIAASAVGSHAIALKGQAEAKDPIGVHKILSTTGTLFGLNNTNYPLFRGNAYNVGAKRLKLEDVQLAVANAANRGSLDSDITIYVNPRTLAKMITTEAGLRSYDQTYKVEEASNGFQSIKFHAQNGKCEIMAHRFIMEGDAFGLCQAEWSRSGSAEVGFNVPGLDDSKMIQRLENQTGWKFTSYSDQYIFCYQPSKNIYFYGINDESAT